MKKNVIIAIIVIAMIAAFPLLLNHNSEADMVLTGYIQEENSLKDGANGVILTYFHLLNNGYIDEAIDMVYRDTEQFRQLGEMARQNLKEQGPTITEVTILETNRVNENLFQVIAHLYEIESSRDYVRDFYTVFYEGEWVFFLVSENVPYRFRAGLIPLVHPEVIEFDDIIFDD